jgi:hypothetical protein
MQEEERISDPSMGSEIQEDLNKKFIKHSFM